MFEQRSARAALLADHSDAAREPLQFAAALSKAQATCVDGLQSVALSGHLENDVDKIVTLIHPILKVIAERSDDLPGLLAHQHGGDRRGCF